MDNITCGYCHHEYLKDNSFNMAGSGIYWRCPQCDELNNGTEYEENGEYLSMSNEDKTFDDVFESLRGKTLGTLERLYDQIREKEDQNLELGRKISDLEWKLSTILEQTKPDKVLETVDIVRQMIAKQEATDDYT